MSSPSQSMSRPDERRGRLVEQQDARLPEDRAGDLDLLAHRRGRGRGPRRRGRRVEAERVEVRRRTSRSRRAPPDHARRARRAHRAGACSRGPSGRGPASSPGTPSARPARGRRAARAGGPRSPESSMRARVRLHEAGQQLDDGRLAGAVLAEQRVDLARARPRSETPSSATVAPKALRRPRLATRPGALAAMASSRTGRRGAAGAAAGLGPACTVSGWPTSAACEADLGRLLGEDRGEPAGVGDDRRLEDVAAGLHLLPGAFLAELDRVVGDERQRQGGELRHVLALELRRPRASARARRNRAARRRRCCG